MQTLTWRVAGGDGAAEDNIGGLDENVLERKIRVFEHGVSLSESLLDAVLPGLHLPRHPAYATQTSVGVRVSE